PSRTPKAWHRPSENAPAGDPPRWRERRRGRPDAPLGRLFGCGSLGVSAVGAILRRGIFSGGVVTGRALRRRFRGGVRRGATATAARARCAIGSGLLLRRDLRDALHGLASEQL